MKNLSRLVAIVLVMVMAMSMLTVANAEGKVLRLTQNVEMDTMDSGNTGDGYTTSIMSLLVDSLFRLDANGVPQGALCESYEVSPDGLTYTFKLRDSKWSNGDPVTAHDFVYAWKRAVTVEYGFEHIFLFNYLPIKNMPEINKGTVPSSELGVSAPDDKTFVVELTAPCTWLTSFLCDCAFGPLNQKFVEACGDQYALSSETLLTCGAFTLDNWTAGDLTWTLTKNPNYWNADKVKLDAIEYQVIKDTQTGIMAFETDAADMVILTSDLVDMYQDSEAFFSAPTTYSWYVVPNFNVPELQNVNLRYALGFAIDREALVTDILADGSRAKYDCNYSDVFFNAAGEEFNSVRPDFWSCDKAAAAKYWEAAKAELNVETLTLNFTVEDSESAQSVAAFIQSEIETACPGLTINLQVMPKAQRLDDMETGNFQLALHRTGSSVPNVLAKLGQYTTGQALNYAKYSNEEFDTLYNATLTETNAEVIWNNCLDLEEMAQKSGVAIPVYRTADCLLLNPSITGYVKNLIGISWDFMFADIAE
ncbi:MAG: peptide ABC transporter substrate-binding protein [Clostridia bacterium]|nr:peptide ABC transporter substrate-binding protein [Clostridia bacterium]